jgi:predicted phage terminase large subunit-like protein
MQTIADSAVMVKRLLDIDWRIEKERCKDYSFFFRASWPEIEPITPLVPNWHIDILCNEIQQQAERIAAHEAKEYDIIINIPPRSLKSSIVSRQSVPYIWSRFPGQKFLTASFSKELALEHAVDSRALIQSPWYQRHWGKMFEMVSDQNVKSFYRNDAWGYRMAVSVGQSSIGKGADWIFIDDPNDPKTAESKVVRLNCINWFLKVMYSRLNNQRLGIRVIVQQRTFEDDLTGYLLANFPGAYKHFCFPGEETEDISPPVVKNYYSNRLFFPERFTKDILSDYRKTLGSDYAGQILQRPAPPEGNIFKRQWWRYWKPKDMHLPERTIRVGDQVHACITIDLPDQFEDAINSWDMGLKGKQDNDPSAGHCWKRTTADFFLIDRSYGLFDDLQCEQEAEGLHRRHPDTSALLIEDEAAGTPVLRRLKLKIPGVIGIQPKGSKRNRARNMAALAQSGNIYLPRPEVCPWVEDFIEEYALFDRGTHDDDVDAGDQAINYFLETNRVFSGYSGQMKNFRVDWSSLSNESRIIIGQYVERNLKSHILIVLFNSQTGILRVLGELVTNNASPEDVLPKIGKLFKAIGADNISIKKVSWFGNEILFAKACGDVSDQYARKLIYIQSVNYNEPGGILKVIRMITAEKLVLHSSAVRCSEDLKTWKYEQNNKPEEGCGLARALCLILEAINENIQLSKPPKGMKRYSKERTKFYETVEELANRGDLDKQDGKISATNYDSKDWAMV